MTLSLDTLRNSVTKHPSLPKDPARKAHYSSAAVYCLLEAIYDADIVADNGNGLPDVAAWNRVLKCAKAVEK